MFIYTLMEKILSNKEFKLKQILDRIKGSKNFEKRDDINKVISIRDTLFLYKNPKKGWEYLFALDSKLKDDPIIYLSNDDFTEISFLDYLGDHKINRLHKRHFTHSDFEGTIEFIEKVVDIRDFIKNLPSREAIEDWFISIEDLGYKIQGIQYGFLEVFYKEEDKLFYDYNVYEIPDGSENEISILITYNKKFELNDEFYDTFEDCKKASKIYLKENFKKLKGIYQTNTSFEISQIEIRFSCNFL
jgi:hypothetical protein